MKKNLLRGMVLCLVMLLLAVSALAAEPAPTVKSVSITSNTPKLYLHQTATLTADVVTESHTWDQGTVTEKPTCTGKGEKTFHCTEQGCDATYTEEIPALGHDWNLENGEVNPDQTQITYSCKRCNETKTEDYTAEPGSGNNQDNNEEHNDGNNNENVTPASLTVLSDETADPNAVTWNSSDTSVLSVSGTGSTVTVTALKAGSATITATAGGVSGTISFTISPVEISCSGLDIPVGDNSTLSPSLTGVPAGTTATYTYEKVSGSITVDPTTGKVSAGTSVGEAAVKITASYKYPDGNTGTVEQTVYIGVYEEMDISAVASKNSFSLGDVDALKSLYFGSSTKNQAGSWSIAQALASFTDASGATLQTKTTATGSLKFPSTSTGTSVSISFVKQVVFHSTAAGGTFEAEYTITSANGRTVGCGTLSIQTSGGGDISYTTDYTTGVAFDEDDFLDFWKSQVRADVVDSDLNYVVFSGGTPRYGTLKTSKSGSTVLVTMNFYPSNVSYSGTNNKPLDGVYYTPDSKATTVTSVTIPFTAVGKDSSEKVYGSVVINFTSEGTEITSRGVAFGSGKISDKIAAEYKTATDGATLAYVQFPSVSASKGKLIYNFSSILESSRVSNSSEYYVDPTRTQYALDKVAFIPRAGLYGKVTIQYTGYDVNGKNAYNGTITFNVTEKTKSAVFSDVTATSYSWAADSVDFLYYEEVANGSNGKYNPKSNITRGDFMLMLYRAFLEEDYEDYNVTSNFPDVVKGTTSYSKETYQAVGVAKYLGIAQGSNGKYNPTSYITREEAMTLIYRTLDEVGYSMSYTVSTSTSSFSDYSSVSSYAQAAIKDLIGHGVVIGTNGKIQPKSNITRAEMAVILHRVLTY